MQHLTEPKHLPYDCMHIYVYISIVYRFLTIVYIIVSHIYYDNFRGEKQIICYTIYVFPLIIAKIHRKVSLLLFSNLSIE